MPCFLAAVLTANDALLKWMTGNYHVAQIMFCRGLFVSIRALFGGGAGVITPDNPKGVYALSGYLVPFCSSSQAFATDAIAILSLVPFHHSTGTVLLGEHVGWRRWIAVLTGLIVIIMRPGGIPMGGLVPTGRKSDWRLRDIHPGARLKHRFILYVAGRQLVWQPV